MSDDPGAAVEDCEAFERLLLAKLRIAPHHERAAIAKEAITDAVALVRRGVIERGAALGVIERAARSFNLKGKDFKPPANGSTKAFSGLMGPIGWGACA